MITNETIRKVVINKSLFPPVTEYAKRTAAGATVDFETNCEKDLSRFNIGYSYNSEDPQGITKANVVQTGANIWDEETEKGRISTTTGENVPDNNYLRTVNYIPVKGGQSYKLYISGSTTKWAAVLTYDKNKTFLANLGGKTGNSVITLNSDVAFVRFYLSDSYGTTYNNDVAFLYPSTLTDYAPYNGTTYEIDFGTTVYGFGLAPITGTGKVRDIDGVESDFTFTPFNITTYNGINNIFLDIPDSSLAITYLVEKPTEYRYAQQFLPIFYPNGSNQERRFIT